MRYMSDIEIYISIHAPTRGATLISLLIACDSSISIHAPTRGATFGGCAAMSDQIISIHAPTRGATYYYFVWCSSCNFDFNPRSHERSDHFSTPFLILNLISIHAPTRGATQASHLYALLILFQSTLPREERLVSILCCLFSLPYFNPRSHERSDSNIAQKICLFLYNTDNKYIIR